MRVGIKEFFVLIKEDNIKMRVLWLSATSSLYGEAKEGKGYNGGGWISSLQRLLKNDNSIILGVAFLYEEKVHKLVDGNTTYYPIYKKPVKGFRKLLNYYGKYKKYCDDWLIESLQNVIADFKPDVIHLWGLENPMSVILFGTKIPVVVHVQGILMPCVNAFYPEGFNKYSFLFNGFSKNEWLLRNGYVFAEKSIKVRSKLEMPKLKKLKYVMGRTEWDYMITNLYAPQSKYFHVDEVMRDIFYGEMKENKRRSLFCITSTISQTAYKGLDVILKTAKILKNSTNIDFVWNVVGVLTSSFFVRTFEKVLNIKSSDVNICYTGVLNEDELYKVLLGTNVYVHPSYIDNSPNSLCEAQMVGRPVVASNVGGVSSLVQHEVNGFLVPANAPFEMAYYLRKLSEDNALLQEMSINAYKTAQKRHDKTKIKNILLGVYNEIVK